MSRLDKIRQKINKIGNAEKDLPPVSKIEFKNDIGELNKLIDDLEKMYDIH